jgi:hypothetical protein
VRSGKRRSRRSSSLVGGSARVLRGEFDRERKSVEPAAYLDHGRLGLARFGALAKQANSVHGWKSRNRVLALTCDPQERAARRANMEIRTLGEHVGQCRRGRQHRLEVVE